MLSYHLHPNHTFLPQAYIAQTWLCPNYLWNLKRWWEEKMSENKRKTNSWKIDEEQEIQLSWAFCGELLSSERQLRL